MYLKKVEGLRQVTLPDGSILSRADLPPAETSRWVASRKALVVKAVIYGLIGRAEALERYGLSEEEFGLWRDAVEKHGEKALRVTTLQKFDLNNIHAIDFALDRCGFARGWLQGSV